MKTPLAGETSYFPGLTNSGYRGGCLIDTGPDESVYRGLDVSEILITHGHADHFSSAAELARAGATVVASRREAPLIEDPEVNIRGMFSWAKPSDEMVTKLFRGEGCRVDVFVDRWHDSGIEAVTLPGHTLGHTGFLTRDGVLFTGDALYEKQLWERHPLPYAIDVALLRRSLERIDELEFEWLVPGHGELASKDESRAHVRHHLDRVDAICEYLLGELRTPRSTEECVAAVSRHVGLRQNPAQYWLAVTTVKGYLSYLVDLGRVAFEVHEHAGYWHTVE